MGKHNPMMRLLPLVLLAGCAHAPAELEMAKRNVDAKITYKNEVNRYKPNLLLKGEKAQGDCWLYAYNYYMASVGYASKNMVEAKVIGCYTPAGEYHTYTRVGEWVLDNRYKWVVHINEQECK